MATAVRTGSNTRSAAAIWGGGGVRISDAAEQPPPASIDDDPHKEHAGEGGVEGEGGHGAADGGDPLVAVDGLAEEEAPQRGFDLEGGGGVHRVREEVRNAWDAHRF